ncbi:hypothetical protein EVC45_34645 [Paraburkholderia sp. UYCP14C]|uniref:hypothetical protein n=1 Tax=Paraburkholderia sp. UYCP14C TaxID=2511130 RepID=UPI00101F2F6B|nr:hypothetical protein [Paraburkholderia sp. UYCP14C]RZF25248.1 hypothetical protein EVC45_34645 [Paraburkholderia sp. UYCP14C]
MLAASAATPVNVDEKDRQTFCKTGTQPLCAAANAVSRFHGFAVLHATPDLQTLKARRYSTG